MYRSLSGLLILFIFALPLGKSYAASLYRLPYPQNHSRIIDQAAALGAPSLAVQQALLEAEGSIYSKKEVVSVFDISQTSNRKRFYLLDLRAGVVSAFHVSHGEGNGSSLRATSFRGFNNPENKKTPLGALVTFEYSDAGEGDFGRFVDRYTGVEYKNQQILRIDGTKSYNDEINSRGYLEVFHTKWYATKGYRNANGGAMGRSWGCIVLDPEHLNQVLSKIEGGSLVYVTVGNNPVENYID